MSVRQLSFVQLSIDSALLEVSRGKLNYSLGIHPFLYMTSVVFFDRYWHLLVETRFALRNVLMTYLTSDSILFVRYVACLEYAANPPIYQADSSNTIVLNLLTLQPNPCLCNLSAILAT